MIISGALLSDVLSFVVWLRVAPILNGIAWLAIVGSEIWGFVEGIQILTAGDAGLAARGYPVATPNPNAGAMPQGYAQPMAQGYGQPMSQGYGQPMPQQGQTQPTPMQQPMQMQQPMPMAGQPLPMQPTPMQSAPSTEQPAPSQTQSDEANNNFGQMSENQ